MKKIYINPTMSVVRIQTQQMIATSTSNPPISGTTDQESDLLSREFSFGDEE